ncbi:MAG: 1-deoxy-D-xylulose-5-phosphate reductoisomerase [Candidatus Omnitrophica bacterium]|nr:1-deoxy-D-xylulose-5-phosphate reductoisomerase [Candidatus Omnitrophota bacterium]
MKKKVVILGSTGSIGTNALDVLSRLGGEFEVTGLSAGSNIGLVSAQARKFRPKFVCAGTKELAYKIKSSLPSGTKVVAGTGGLKEIVASCPADIFLIAISGTAAIIPLVEAVKKNKRIALANKEALISAGPVVMELAAKSGAEIIPVDSEHSAIFQCLEGKREYLSRIYLTGSGGPLLDVSAAKFDSIARRRILKHPKWKMGRKITIDSATMMNKGLEIIEARYLFGIGEDKIDVLIHPEAIIHSMVEFADGAVLAQLAVPDMRIPIQYALTYPARKGSHLKSVDFTKVKALSFRPPDGKKFPCLELARRAVRAGGTSPAALCAADEEAVRCYLEGSIKFSEIPEVIEKVISRHKNTKKTGLSIGDILDAGRRAKEEARAICYH